jgi:hypothetical protein
VAELSDLLVLAWQHAGDSGHHPPSLFSLSSQLCMQEVSHMPANTFQQLYIILYFQIMVHIMAYLLKPAETAVNSYLLSKHIRY